MKWLREIRKVGLRVYMIANAALILILAQI